MDKSKKIMLACIAALAVICAVAVGILIGSRMGQSKPAAAETVPAESTVQELTAAKPTEYIPAYAEPETEWIEPEEIETAAPVITQPPTKAPTTKAPTTRPATTKAAATQPTTTQPAPTQAPTTKAPTTAAPTTQPSTTTTTKRNGPYALIVNSDSGASEFSGGGRYAPGEFVKVTMTPKLGYKFVRWESSDTKALPNSTSQTYVFQMPETTVSLHAVTIAQPLLTINKTKGISYASSSRYYSAGEKVTVTAQVESGYEFAGWSSSTGTGTASAGLTSNSLTFSFTMPDRSITLTASAKAKGYALTLYAGTGVRSVTGAGRYNAGDKVTLYVLMKDGYTMNSFDGLNASYNGNYVTFNMPAKDLTLTVTGRVTEKYTVTVIKGEGVLDVQGAGTYTAGDTVTLRCTPEKGYKFKMWETSNVQVLTSSWSPVYSFKMPGANVTLTATAEKEEEKYLVAIERGRGIYSVDGSGMYAAGERVTVDCTVDNGYTFSSWTITGLPSANEVSTKRYSFIMPKGEVRLKANARANDQEVYAIPS